MIEYFRRFGKVEHCYLIRNEKDGSSTGFGFLALDFYTCELEEEMIAGEHFINGGLVKLMESSKKKAHRERRRLGNRQVVKVLRVSNIPEAAREEQIRSLFS